MASLERLPIAVQAIISRTVAARSAAFDARRAPGGFQLVGGGLTATLSRDGVTVHSGGGPLNVQLSAVGRWPASRSAVTARALLTLTAADDANVQRSDDGRLGAAVPVAHRNRVSYARRGVQEWYAAGPLGLEQGFSLPRRPAGRRGNLMLTLRLSGPLLARMSGPEIVFRARGRVVLRYGGLQASDASGRSLPAAMTLRGRFLLVRVRDRDARYPVSIDPLIVAPPALTAAADADFGFDVALSANGQTALVGGYNDDGGKGGAWMFTRSGTTWSQQGAELVGDCSSNCAGEGSGESGNGNFGASVALSADGDTALIGAPGSGGNAGAAWIFVRNGASWGPASNPSGGKLSISSTGFFGESVALSTDGGTALIGSWGDNSNAGSAYVFSGSSGAGWTKQATLDPSSGCPSGAGGRFGFSVALSSAGTTALIGSPLDDNGAGTAWVFTGSDASWTQQAELVADGAGRCPGANGTGEEGQGNFGSSVALSPDGGTALIGAPDDSADAQSGTDAGAAWLFTGSGATWRPRAKLIGDCTGTCAGPNGTGETGAGQFGLRVALSNDGVTALVGAPADEGEAGASSDGGAWVFGGSPATGWSQDGPELVGDCTSACNGNGSGEQGAGFFGNGVAISSDGSAALIGAPRDGTSGDTGAVWTFGQPPACSNVAASTPSGGGSVTVALSCNGPLGAPLAYAVVSSPANGTLASIDQAGGTVSYTSRPGFVGSDTFTYDAGDAAGASNTVTVTITVPPPPPLCANVNASTPAGGGSVTVKLSCTAPAGAALTYAIVAGPAHGGLGSIAQSSGAIIYTSQSRLSGTDTFGYAASNSGGTSQTATVTITIPPAPPPTVSIVGSARPVVGLASTYAASVIDVGATPNHFRWTVNGRTIGTRSSISFTFTTGTRAKLVLTVGDTNGASVGTSVTVKPTYRQLTLETPWTGDWTRAWTQFTSLAALAVPSGAAVRVICHGVGCPFAEHAVRVNAAPVCHSKKCTISKRPTPGTRDIDLSALLAGRQLQAGARLQISFTLRYFVGQLTTFVIEPSGPHHTTACLAPGTTRMTRAC